MLDSLLDRRTTKKFEALCDKIADIEKQKEKLEKAFMKKTTRETIDSALNIIDQSGHPIDKNASKLLRQKYESGEKLDFEDIVSLIALYKSNCFKPHTEDESNE